MYCKVLKLFLTLPRKNVTKIMIFRLTYKGEFIVHEK